MTQAQVDQLLDLPVDERLEVAQLLWDSVTPADEARFVPIPAWQRRMLDQRLADLEAKPGDEQGWEEVKAELWPTR